MWAAHASQLLKQGRDESSSTSAALLFQSSTDVHTVHHLFIGGSLSEQDGSCWPLYLQTCSSGPVNSWADSLKVIIPAQPKVGLNYQRHLIFQPQKCFNQLVRYLTARLGQLVVSHLTSFHKWDSDTCWHTCTQIHSGSDRYHTCHMQSVMHAWPFIHKQMHTLTHTHPQKPIHPFNHTH